MSKVLDEASENNNELNEVENQKNLCVHELKKKLRVKQKRQFIKNTIILSFIITLIILSFRCWFLSLLLNSCTHKFFEVSTSLDLFSILLELISNSSLLINDS